MRLFFWLSLLVLAWTPTAASARPSVAIIDSGVAPTRELKSSLVAEYDVAGPGTGDRAPFHPRYDHGTMVATILLREAKEPVDIISYRIDDPAGCPKGVNPPCQPSAEPIAKAIRHATDLGVTVINLSLSLADDPVIVEAVRRAAAKGIWVVMAAGNEGWDHPGNLAMARAGYPNAVLVGATDAKGRIWSGTNRPGAKATDFAYVWREGVDVPATLADGSDAYGTGTSFAAPREAAHRLMHASPIQRSTVAQAPMMVKATVRTEGAAAGR
jgi:hypothetical protein